MTEDEKIGVVREVLSGKIYEAVAFQKNITRERVKQIVRKIISAVDSSYWTGIRGPGRPKGMSIADKLRRDRTRLLHALSEKHD